MLLGHYGIAFAAKRAVRSTSLGWLTFAAQWLDELWPALLLAGVEHARADAHPMAANSLEFVSYPYSHSLAMTMLWSVVIGGVYYARRRARGPAVIVGLAVLSHWLLDLPMHRPDLPLWPGSSLRVGLGLWNSVAATIVLEALFLVGGLAIYVRTTRARDRVGSWALWGMVALLVLMFASGFAGPPPPNEKVLGATALTLWLFVPWSWWVDRHRELISPR